MRFLAFEPRKGVKGIVETSAGSAVGPLRLFKQQRLFFHFELLLGALQMVLFDKRPVSKVRHTFHP